MNKKIRNSQLEQWNYILVAGEEEMKNGTVNVRTRANERLGEFRVDKFVEHLKAEIPKPSDKEKDFYAKAWKPETFGFEPEVNVAPKQAAGGQMQLAQEPAFVEVPFTGAPTVPKKSSNPKFGEIEGRLGSKKAEMYLGGKTPSYEDREMLEELGSDIPDAESYPNAFAWYCIVSKFSPEIRATWGGLRPLKSTDWQAAIDPGSIKKYDTKFADSLEAKKKAPKPAEIEDEWADVVEPKKSAKAKDDDDFDPFADDDDDDAGAAESLKKKAEESKAKKKKAAPAAKSLIIWEVKPYGPETDLDALGKKIIAEIKKDGLVWKTEFKIEPIAFGVCKIVIGATIEDSKVSTDDVQEEIEEFEDVQSIDILAFNKL